MDKKKQPSKKDTIRSMVGVNSSNRTEEALALSEERYRNILDNMQDSYIEVDLAGNFTFINEATCRNLGYTAKELIGQNFSIIASSQEELRAVFHAFNEVYKTGEPNKGFAFKVVRKDGTTGYTETSIALLKDGQGRLIGFRGVGRDVTERKQTEEELKKSEANLHSLFNTMAEGVVLIAADGQIISANSAAESILGLTRSQIEGRAYDSPQWELLRPDGTPMPAEEMAGPRAMKEKRMVKDVVMGAVQPDGMVRWIRVNAAPFLNANSEIGGIVGTFTDITEHKKAEEALRESEANFRTFFDSVGDMVIVGSPDGKILHTNPAMSLKLGYSPTDFKNMHVLDVHPSEKRLEAEEIFAAMFKGERETCPLPLQRKDGVLIPVETRVWRGKWSGTDCIFGICKDLTREQEALQKFDRLFGSNPAPMAVSILPGRELIDVNDAWLSALGYSREEVLGRSTGELGLFAQPEKGLEIAELLQTQGCFAGLELKAKCKDGTILDGLFSGEIIESQGGKYLLTVMVDLTERKRAEEALLEERWRLQSIIEGTRAGTWEWNVQTGETVFNDIWAQILGYTLAELSPISIKTWEKLAHPGDLKQSDELLERHFSGELPYYDCECRMKHKDGHWVWVHDRGRVITRTADGKSLMMFGTHSDISDHKRMEEEQQKVEKLESIGILAAGIAHNFNNILTSILGNISLARMDAAPGSEIQESLEHAEKASLRAKDLTLQLLTFSKGGAPVKELASLTELLKDTANSALTGSKVKGHFSIPADLWQAEIDARQISQIIHNLVTNARQAMPAGGTIEISAENIVISEKQSLGKLLPLKAGDYIRVRVADHGCGIPAEHLEKIFDPFFTTKINASGLGVATSFSIARQHDGHLSVESEVGSGSTFSLYLPASAPKQDNKKAIKAAGKARILVMDDEKGVREVAGRMLEHLGYADVEFAEHGAEAIKRYKEAMEMGNPFSVAILDLTIPGGMGGEVTVGNLIKIDPAVKAIVSSGYIDDPVMAKYREYGFRGMITKPYTIAELRKAVQDVIG